MKSSWFFLERNRDFTKNQRKIESFSHLIEASERVSKGGGGGAREYALFKCENLRN